MPEQAEQSRNDYLALISRLENAGTDEAKGVKPVQAWHGVDWPSLIAEMNEMKSLPPHPRGFRFEAWLAELFKLFNSSLPVRLSETQANRYRRKFPTE